MTKVFIAEKNDISKVLQQAFFSTTTAADGTHRLGAMSDGTPVIVLTAQGHILNMLSAWDINSQTKEEYYEAWNSNREIFTFKDPEQYLKFLKIGESSVGIKPKDRLKKFKELLKDETDVEFICATDPDDEGAAIYANIMEFLGQDPYASNSKALYTGSTTPDAFRAEYKKLKTFASRKPEVDRARARALFDATYGWNVTNSLRKPMGRLKGAIISLVGENEFNKRNHVQSFTYAVDITYDGEKFSNKFTFETKGEAEEAIAKFKEAGATISHKLSTANKSKGVPSLHNEISLTKAAGSKISGDLSKVGNDLRLKHHLITYMRTKDTVLGADSAKGLNRNIKNFAYMDGFSLVDKVPASSIAKGEITHDAIHVTGELPTGKNLTADEETVFDEVLRRTMANMSKAAKYKAYTTSLVSDYEAEWFTGYNFTENVIADFGFMEIYPEGGVSHVEEGNLRQFNGGFELSVREIEAKPKGRFNVASMKTKLDKIASDIDDPELKALYKEVEGIGTTATVEPTILDMGAKGLLKVKGKGKTIEITEDGYKLYLHMKEHKVPLIDLKTSAIMEKQLNAVRDGELTISNFLKGVEPEINDICQILLDNSMSSGGGKAPSNATIIEKCTCPKCKETNVRMAYVNGKTKDENTYALAQCEKCREATFLKIGDKLLDEKLAKAWLQGKVINIPNVNWPSGKTSTFNGKLNFADGKWEFVNDENAVRKVDGAMIYKGCYIKNEVTVKIEGKDVKLKITEAAIKNLVDKQAAKISKVNVAATFTTPKKAGDLIFINLTVVA